MIIPQLELGPRLCVHSHFSSQGTRKLTPLVSQAHVSKKTVVIVRFFLRRDLGTPVGSISLLSMYVLVMFVENNQILPWHSFWFGWSVGNCILYRFQDVYRSWLPVELKHEIVFPAALIKHHYSRGQKVKHGDILIYETDHHYLRRIPHRRNKRFTDKVDKKIFDLKKENKIPSNPPDWSATEEKTGRKRFVRWSSKPFAS